MYARNLSGVSLIALVSLALSLGVLSIPAARAGVIYTFDRGAGTNVWETAANWDVGGSDPTNPPGSLLNGSGGTVVDDQVLMPNPTTGGKTISLTGTDAGTIDSLHIGGGGAAMTLQPKNDGANLVVTNNVTLGGVQGTTQRAGNLTVGDNKNVTMTINGNIVSGGTGDNDIIINTTNTATGLTLLGDIDSAGTHEIDLNIRRGSLNWSGTAMYLEEFNVVEIGNANVTNLWTLGPGQTIVASARGDIGRNASTASQTNKTVNGTFNIYGGTFESLQAGESLVVGNVAKDPNSGTSTAVGVVNVGDPTEPAQVSTLTLAGELKVGPSQNDSKAGTQSASGTLNVNNAGSVVTINGGIEMSANGNELNSATAVININDGLVTVYKHIEDAENTSTINLSGGTLHLATATLVTHASGHAARAVDTFNMEDGATLKMTFSGQAMPLTAPAMDLDKSAGGGNATLDIETPPADSMLTGETAEWDGGGTGNDWTTVANWDPDVLPSQRGAALINGTTYTLLETGGAAITNQANIQLDAGDTGWTLDLTDTSKVQATRTGASVGFGPAIATISDAGDTVTRSADLNIQNAAGQSADAAQLDISDGSLTLSGTSSLILGGTAAQGHVNQSGGTVSIGGDRKVGAAANEQGGAYHVTNDATLTVTGNVIMADPTVNQAQFYLDTANATITGNTITVRSLRVGEAAGQTGSLTLDATKTLTCTGWLYAANNGTGTVTVNGATVNVQAAFAANEGIGILNINSGDFTITDGEMKGADNAAGNGTINIGVGGGAPTVSLTGGNVEPAEDGVGLIRIDSGTITQNTDNVVVGQNTNSVGTFTMNGGTYDLRPATVNNANHGCLNLNNTKDGEMSVVNILGTAILYVGNDIQLSNNAGTGQEGEINIGSGADTPTVWVADDINNRGGTTAMNLKSGILQFNEAGADNAMATDIFNWTGGTIGGLETYTGSLTQENADAASLLRIGASAGTMSITEDYTLAAAGTDTSTLEIEIFGDGTGGAGADYDFLSVTGTATFHSDSDVALILDGYTPVDGDSWDILDAGAITVVGNVNDLFDTSQAGLDPGLSWDFGDFATDGTVKVIPEPATLALLALGGLALLRRRKP